MLEQWLTENWTGRQTVTVCKKKKRGKSICYVWGKFSGVCFLIFIGVMIWIFICKKDRKSLTLIVKWANKLTFPSLCCIVLICAVRIANLMQTGFILTASNKVTWMCSFLISWLEIKFVGNKFGNKKVLFSHCV